MSDVTQKIKVAFQTAMMEFGNFDTRMRPPISRLYPVQKVKNKVTVINTCIIPNRITQKNISSVVYAATITTARMLDFKIRTSDQIGRNNR